MTDGRAEDMSGNPEIVVIRGDEQPGRETKLDLGRSCHAQNEYKVVIPDKAPGRDTKMDRGRSSHAYRKNTEWRFQGL